MNQFISGTLVCLCIVLPVSRSKADAYNATLPHNEKSVRSLIEVGFALRHASLDCSHFVHALYERLGRHYQYATSRRLYHGFTGFQRTQQPMPGDLVVWPGHVGVVLEPRQQSFLSSLASGIKVSSYSSSYWLAKGQCRFFHFVGVDGHRSPDPSPLQAQSEYAGS
jgi:hypothetical protein